MGTHMYIYIYIYIYMCIWLRQRFVLAPSKPPRPLEPFRRRDSTAAIIYSINNSSNSILYYMNYIIL